ALLVDSDGMGVTLRYDGDPGFRAWVKDDDVPVADREDAGAVLVGNVCQDDEPAVLVDLQGVRVRFPRIHIPALKGPLLGGNEWNVPDLHLAGNRTQIGRAHV